MCIRDSHLEMSIEWKGERVGIFEMRRHYTNYFKGIPHFKDHRIKLVTQDTQAGLLETFQEIRNLYSEGELA